MLLKKCYLPIVTAMSYAKLLQKIEEHIAVFYTQHFNHRMVYHTYSRAAEVVSAAGKISKYYHLDERQAFIVCAAAWFHDTGYLISHLKSPEVKSTELAQKFLSGAGASEEDIAEIKKCILTTQNPGNAASLPEKILCDAGTFYIGTSKFKANRKLLRKEFEAFKKIKIEPAEWIGESIRMLESHHFQTDYCKTVLNNRKEENLNKLKNKQMEMPVQDDSLRPSASDPTEPDELMEMNERLPGEKGPKRGIETMFRISSSNSQKISAMADNKAHIMISVNSIIISVVLGLILGKLDQNRHLIIPTLILLAVNVTTIIYSILATRPKVHKGIFTREQVEKKSVNLLFYGSFYNMDLKEFDSGMREMMNDREFLYGSLIKDIYWQGKVLGRKYKFLHTSYNIFMYGIVLSVIAYAIAVYFAH